MRLAVFVETDSADDGRDEPQSFQEHEYNIREALRDAHYEVDYVDEARDGE